MIQSTRDVPVATGQNELGRWWMLIVALAALATYSSVMSFDFVNYDDPAFVYENRSLERGVTPTSLRWAF